MSASIGQDGDENEDNSDGAKTEHPLVFAHAMEPVTPSSSVLMVLVERILQEGLGHSINVQKLELLDEKVGQRCVARAYFVDPRGVDQQLGLVYAKWFADEERGKRTYDDLKSVGDAMRQFGDVRIPRSMGMSREPCLMVFEEVPGVPLTHLSERQRKFAAPHIGRAIAQLQQCGAELSRHYVLDDELRTIGQWSREIAASGAPPSIVERFNDIAEEIRRKSQRFARDSDSQVVVHRDLHDEHIFVEQKAQSMSIGIVDFDEVRLGDPYVDIAHLAVHLKLRDRTPYPVYRGAQVLSGEVFDSVIQAWSEHSGCTMDSAKLEFYAGITCLKVARQRTVGFGTQPRPTQETRWLAVENCLELAEDLLDLNFLQRQRDERVE